MTDRATPNLPSRAFADTAEFYRGLGFSVSFQDEGWMIVDRGPITIEFFPYAVDPKTTIASCCLRVDDLDGLHAAFLASGLADSPRGMPRMSAPVDQPWGMREFVLVDPDGNLIRCLQNQSPEGAA